MINLLNHWSINWWMYFIPLIIQNTIFLLVVYGAIVYLKKATAAAQYSIGLLGLIKLLIPAFLPISWISISYLSAPNFNVLSMGNGIIGAVGNNSTSMQNLNIYSIFLIVWLTVCLIMILLPLISFWRIKYRLRQAVLIETISNNSGSAIQVFKTDSIALPMTMGFRSKKIFVPQIWENWSEEYRMLAISHEISHINRHDGLISGLQTLVQALYFFHPLVWILNRRFDELREMICDEFAIDSQDNDSITYSRFLADVAENMVLNQVDYPTMSSLIKKKTELFNRIQYLLEDKMQKPKNLIRVIVPAMIGLTLLLSWNCQDTNSMKSQSNDQTDLGNTINSKSSPPPPPEGPRVKFIPYDDPPLPLTPIRPKYPEIAQEAGIEGTVVVQVFVDENGLVDEAVILQGVPNSELDEAAAEAIKAVRFDPAKQKGKPVGVWISIPVNFRLDNKTEK